MCKRHQGSNLLLREDGVPLRTKIVATIGTPEIYRTRAEDLAFRRIASCDYEYLVEQFYLNGADVLRINCSHVALDEIAERYQAIRSAILACERKHGKGKRMAVLADLPGPKIRFQVRPAVTLSLGDSLTIHFRDTVSDGTQQTVYVDGKPLREAMDEASHRGAGGAASTLQAIATNPAYAENVLGCLGGGVSRAGFDTLMEAIRHGTAQAEPLLVFVGDGEVVLRVMNASAPDSLECIVLSLKDQRSATLEGNKGFTLKGVDFDIPSFTGTDEALLHELLRAEHEQSKRDPSAWEPVLAFVALSFVQTADDVLRARESMERWLADPSKAGLTGSRVRLESPALVAKIETRKGVRNRDFILDVADSVMVARGDLGMQMKIEDVPRIQKELVSLCNKRGKPVITATEMLKSMTDNVEPTRAEASDVYNAIHDGTDAVMLSEESAKGRFPFHAVRKMVSIAERAELHIEMKGTDLIPRLKDERCKALQRQRMIDFLRDDFERIHENEARLEMAAHILYVQSAYMQTDDFAWRISLYKEKLGKAQRQETTNRITHAACTLTEAMGTRAIVTPTASGRTARMISRLRPFLPIVAVTHDIINMRKLVLSFGVIPVCVALVDSVVDVGGLITEFRKGLAVHPFLRGWLKKGDKVIFTAGTPVRTPGTTNVIQSIDI